MLFEGFFFFNAKKSAKLQHPNSMAKWGIISFKKSAAAFYFVI